MLRCPTCGTDYRERSLRSGVRVCPRDGARLRPASELDWRVSTLVGNYRLIDLLGRGAMGVVYRGEHAYIGKPVAIKILHDGSAGDPVAVQRLLNEARAAAMIGHANIIEVSDFGMTTDGLTYFVMELVEGQSLGELLAASGPLPLVRAITIVNQIGRGLAAAHEKKIIHRDLKPENVMLEARAGRRDVVRRASADRFVVEREASYDFVKILDFGVAEIIDSQTFATSGEGRVCGTPCYMAPEVVDGTADHRADIYALGVLFYEMLTGTVPFDAADPVDVFYAHRKSPVPPIRERCPTANVTIAAERLILRAMAKDPAERPATMTEFLAALAKCYGNERFLRDVEVQMVDQLRRDARAGLLKLSAELAHLFDGKEIDEPSELPLSAILASTTSAAPMESARPARAALASAASIPEAEHLFEQSDDREEVFATLCRAFRAHFDFVAVLTVGDQTATTRMALGDSWVDREALAAVAIPLTVHSAVRAVAQSNSPHAGILGTEEPLANAMRQMGRTPLTWGVLFPVSLRDRVVAILYADGKTDDLAAATRLLPLTARAADRFERIILRRKNARVS